MKVSPLGPLEQQVMDAMWSGQCQTGREVWEKVKASNQVAYTTVMTIMNRLVEKKLLTKSKVNGKTYSYQVVQSKQQSMRTVISQALDKWVTLFGEEALATFIDEADRVKQHRKK